MNRIQKTIGSVAITSLLMLAPLAASADSVNATGSAGVVINPNGIVRVIGADVTAVSNGVVDAVTHFGNVVLNWVVNISDATKIAANGSVNGTTTDIKVGDKVSFKGSLASSTGSTLTVAAVKIRDLITAPFSHHDEDATTSVNAQGSGNVDTDNDGDHDANVNASATGKVESEHSDGIHAGLNFLGNLRFGKDD